MSLSECLTDNDLTVPLAAHPLSQIPLRTSQLLFDDSVSFSLLPDVSRMFPFLISVSVSLSSNFKSDKKEKLSVSTLKPPQRPYLSGTDDKRSLVSTAGSWTVMSLKCNEPDTQV